MGLNYGIMVQGIRKRFLLSGKRNTFSFEYTITKHCMLLHTINKGYPIEIILHVVLNFSTLVS